MKTSEEKLNEALRAALKRKFDNYEGVPFSSPFAEKPGRLERGRKWKYLFFTGLFLGILAGGIMLDQHFEKSRTVKIDHVDAKKVADDVHSFKQDKNTKIEMNVAHRVLAKKQIQPKSNEHIYLKIKDKNIAINSSSSNSILENTKHSSDYNQVINHENKLSIIENNITFTEPEENNFENKRSEINLEFIPKRGTTFDNPKPTLPFINGIENPEVQSEIIKKTHPLNWLFNVSALHTYQLLTVPPSPGQNLQNFSFPAAFSLRSLGYKFSIGIEKKGLQLMLHYNGFRRSYSYEIVGNDYIVEPGSQGDYKIVRQAMQVSEDKKVSLLGVGIQKKIDWGRSQQSRFYAAGGLEYSHSLNSHQSLGWVNIGVGKQFPVNKNMLFQVGPYAEFSPVKISGSGDPFFYQPYRIGISLGIKLANP